MTTLLPILLRYIWFNFLSRNDIIKSIALLYALVHEREIEIVERVSPGRNTDLLASMDATSCPMRHGKSKQSYAMFWRITESFTNLKEITDFFRTSTKNRNPNWIRCSNNWLYHQSAIWFFSVADALIGGQPVPMSSGGVAQPPTCLGMAADLTRRREPTGARCMKAIITVVIRNEQSYRRR